MCVLERSREGKLLVFDFREENEGEQMNIQTLDVEIGRETNCSGENNFFFW